MRQACSEIPLQISRVGRREVREQQSTLSDSRYTFLRSAPSSGQSNPHRAFYSKTGSRDIYHKHNRH